MTNAALQMQIADDSGLPLVDVQDMGLWDYPDAAADDIDPTTDHDLLDDLDVVTAGFDDDFTEADWTGHTAQEYRMQDWMERGGFELTADPDLELA